MLMALFFIAAATASAWVGKAVLGRWFQHITIYSVTWGVSLALYSLKGLRYFDISLEAWVFIAFSWAFFLLGCVLARLCITPSCAEFHLPENLGMYLWILAGLGTIGGISQLKEIGSTFGMNPFVAIAAFSNQIYTRRFNGELGGIPYLSFMPFAGCTLAGVYARRLGRINWTAAANPIVMVFAGLVNMQRAGIVVCFLLAGFSFTLTPQTRKFALPRKQLATLVVSALFGFFLITSNRGIVVYLAGESAQLYKLGEISPTIPNLYFYLSGPPATLSSYLSRGSEPRFLGRMTFAPVYRAAAKLGFDTYVPYYQKFYPTPEDMNTATYLRDIHADYGLAGVMLFPPLLGFTVTFFSLRCNTGVKVVVLAHLLVLVTFTFSSSILITGYWYVSLITSSGAMLLAKRFVQTPVMPL